MGYAFSTGTLVYNDVIVGTLQDVSLDQSSSLIPLQGNMRAPLANALGPGKMSGTAKFTSFDPTFLSTITNVAMGPASGVAMIWYITDSAGVVKSITMPAVTLTSLKLSASADKWLESSISFECACTGGTGALATVATEAGGIPGTHDPAAGKWAFSSGAFTLQTHVVGTINDISLDISWSTIPLTSNYRYPVAVAQGPIKVSGSTKFSTFDTNFVETITNSVMAAPSTELTAVWVFTDTAAVTHTITLPNVTIGGWKLSAGVDKWLATDVTFEAAAAAADSNIVEVT
jgi:hypothetical protein